ncbi:hemerythrin domain-containing protein [Anaeroselena agilis]|uniref:Hemerythrin domain-containing protein n=1 Tax=Anaeroselena agilis TaxID=3063788 RepID=A0ABU3P0A5_9FIRM|nr:hemerythrin domain-containing protein [Selenomonadales bacterium 4137-cl]
MLESEQRAAMIVDLVERYKGGADSDQIKREAKAVFAFVRPETVALAEERLARHNLDPADLHQLHRLHLDNLRHELLQLQAAIEPWHPVRTMIEEHEQILATLERLEALNARVQAAAALDPAARQELADIAANLLAAEYHHRREEEVVFPELTKRGIGATVEAMEAEHEELRERKHALKALAARGADGGFEAFRRELGELAAYIVYNLGDHIYKENHIMFPAAVRLVREEGLWPRLKERCDEIGYCNFRKLH